MSKFSPPDRKADILIIDDTPDNLRLLNQILGKYYKVRLAPSGAIGLTAAKSTPPDLILLDVMMPEMSGYEVASQLKAAKETSDIPFIFISALDDTESKIKGFAVGGVDYVTKPFQEAEVLARVNTHLSMRILYKQAQNEIAERKRAEESLRTREQEYKTLVENTPDVIARFDRQFRHTYVNPVVEKEFGISPAILLGKTHRELGQPPASADWSENIMRQVFETRKETIFELTRPSPMGNIYYLSRCVPEFGDDGSVISVLVIHRNITERKRAEDEISSLNDKLEHRVVERTAQLELALKELESLSYTVSHDLRSPMRAVVGYSQIIRNEYGETLPAEVIRLLGLMSDNAQFMGAMIDGLLKFMQFNRITLKMQDLDPNQLVKQALITLSRAQDARKIEIIIHPMPACKGDPEMLQDVWYNLLSNAIKFSRPRDLARIEVGNFTTEGEIVFYVKDNGVGFNMDYSGNLFKVFHRLHHVTEFEGIGMGLALAQRAIQRHAGRIWAEAQENKGAAFYFTLG